MDMDREGMNMRLWLGDVIACVIYYASLLLLKQSFFELVQPLEYLQACRIKSGEIDG